VQQAGETLICSWKEGSMATGMLMEWANVTPDKYEQVMALLGLDANPPAGGNFHAAGFTRDAMYVFDIWDSQQAFEKFQRERLEAAVKAVGLTSPPKVTFIPLHNLYAPNIDMLRKAGASSLPPVKV
jgi:hypothetical protein